VAEIAGQDEVLAAQCLRMAHSALFSRGPALDSLRAAVRRLGTAPHSRRRCLMRIAPARPASAKALDSVVFWQHSLACAIIARKLAPAVGFSDPEKAYLAGLLHDIGYILNLVAFPEQPETVIEEAARDRLFMGEVEYSNLGFTHRQTGECWRAGRTWQTGSWKSFFVTTTWPRRSSILP